MTPESLYAQQVHGQDLPDNLFMRETDVITGIRLPQQACMFQQPGMHGLQRGNQRRTVGGAGQDHHHKPAAEDPDNHLTDARLCNIPQFGGIEHIDDREGNDGRGIAR